MSPLLWTFFSPSVVTWHTSVIHSVRVCSEAGVTLFSQVENTDALFYLPLASIVYFKLVRCRMMAGYLGYKVYQDSVLCLSPDLKFFLLLIEILAAIKKHTVLTLGQGTSRKLPWIILLSLLQEVQMCYTQVI